MNTTTTKRTMRLTSLFATVAIVGLSLGIYSCNKNNEGNTNTVRTGSSGSITAAQNTTTAGKVATTRTLSSLVTVADIRAIEGSPSVEVIFNENTEFFNVSDAAAIAILKEAFSAGKPIHITFDPWQGVVLKAAYPSSQDLATFNTRRLVNGAGSAMKLDMSHTSDATLDNGNEMGIMNTTDPGLNNLIPDFATAQLMFDYIAHQCCELPGPYAIDYCIPFQYCIDGCYARAHKMCWIINNRYKYGTKKIFSFANSGSDKLCVQGQKWGGCCIRWWYHVAPLVTIKTPTGPKAYVFDPAMFNQPVLLSTWLHAQENPACAGSWTPNVTMINVQPTASYAPSGMSGLVFSTDPSYTATNGTLNSYSALITCP